MSYDSMNVDQLKEKCREMGLPVSGKKSDLIERLNNPEEHKKKGGGGSQKKRKSMEEGGVGELVVTKGTPTKKKEDAAKALAESDQAAFSVEDIAKLAQLRVDELKEMARSRGLMVGGSKKDLLMRIYAGKKLSSDEQEKLDGELFHKNDGLADMFEELAAEAEQGSFQGRALKQVALLLRVYPIPITDAKQALKIKGIGKGSARHIEEFFETGKSAPTEKKARVVVRPSGGGAGAGAGAGGGEEDEDGGDGGEEDGDEEGGGAPAPAAGSSSSSSSSSGGSSGSKLDAEILSVLKSNFGEGEGVSTETLTSTLQASSSASSSSSSGSEPSAEAVRASLARLSAKGLVYTTVDENTFAPVV